jgi:hypothetical protein
VRFALPLQNEAGDAFRRFGDVPGAGHIKSVGGIETAIYVPQA